SFVVIVLSTVLLGWIDWTLRNRIAPSGIGGIVPGLIPPMTSLFDLEYRNPPPSFGPSLARQARCAGALLFLAGPMLKRFAIGDGSFQSRVARLAKPPPAAKQQLRRNPIYWLSLRHRWRWLTTWILMCLLVLLWTAALTIFDFSRTARILAVF